MNTNTTATTTSTNAIMTTFIVSKMMNVQSAKTGTIAGYNHAGEFKTETQHHYIQSTTRLVRKSTKSQQEMLEAVKSGQFEVRINGKFICNNISILDMQTYQVANLRDEIQGLPEVIIAAIISKAQFYVS